MPLKQSYSVSTISELANYNSSHCEVIFVNDAVRTSGNPFRWAGNTFKANGGTIYPGLGGVWEMMFNGPVNVNWFGAIANGTDVTAKFQKAVDYAFEVARPVYVPGNPVQNVYALDQVNLYDTSIVYGDYRRTIIIPASGNVKAIFNIHGQNFKDVKTFNNLYKLTLVNQLTTGPITTGCTALSVRFVDELHLNELIIDGFDININIENCSSIYGNKIRLRGASRNNLRVTWENKGAPYVGGWVFMTECEFNGGNFAHAEPAEKFSIFIENMSTIILDKCVIAGNLGGGVKFVQTYLQPAKIKDMGFITISSCDIDSNHGVGIRGEYCRNCVIKANWISSGRENVSSGIQLFNCESSSVVDNHAFYCGFCGIEVINSRYINVSGNFCQANGISKSSDRAGIKISNSKYNTVANNICNQENYGYNASQLNGILADVTSDSNIFNANILIPSQTPIKATADRNNLNNNIQ